MLVGADLLDLARLLAASAGGHPDARFRRSVSTAYYAVFHDVLHRAAERFVGAAQGNRAAYALVYRGFTHSRMKDVCREIIKPSLRAPYRERLQRPAVGQEMRYFARAFIELQEARQSADYDPQALIGQSDADRSCALADFAFRVIAAANAEEVGDVLALMLVPERR